MCYPRVLVPFRSRSQRLFLANELRRLPVPLCMHESVAGVRLLVACCGMRTSADHVRSPSSTFEILPEENGVVGELAFQISTSQSLLPSHASQSQQVLPLNNYTQQGPFDHSFEFETFVWNLQTAQVPPTISLAPECEAVPFFFKNFTALPQEAESTRGFLEYLVPLYNRARPNSVLHLATTAVALAACGQYPGRHELLREAVSTYGKAIKKLNEDLKHPAKAKSNETVVAILMFSLYEVSRIFKHT